MFWEYRYVANNIYGIYSFVYCLLLDIFFSTFLHMCMAGISIEKCIYTETFLLYFVQMLVGWGVMSDTCTLSPTFRVTHCGLKVMHVVETYFPAIWWSGSIISSCVDGNLILLCKKCTEAIYVLVGLVCQGYVPEKLVAIWAHNSHLKHCISWGLGDWQILPIQYMSIWVGDIQTSRVNMYYIYSIYTFSVHCTYISVQSIDLLLMR